MPAALDASRVVSRRPPAAQSSPSAPAASIARHEHQQAGDELRQVADGRRPRASCASASMATGVAPQPSTRCAHRRHGGGRRRRRRRRTTVVRRRASRERQRGPGDRRSGHRMAADEARCSPASWRPRHGRALHAPDVGDHGRPAARASRSHPLRHRVDRARQHRQVVRPARARSASMSRSKARGHGPVRAAGRRRRRWPWPATPGARPAPATCR